MLRIFTILLVACMLTLTACDAAEVFKGGPEGQPSQAQEITEVAEPFIPAGMPRLIFDLLQSGLAVTAAVMARKGASKELAANEAREYTLDEAESMLAAMERVKTSATLADGGVAPTSGLKPREDA